LLRKTGHCKSTYERGGELIEKLKLDVASLLGQTEAADNSERDEGQQLRQFLLRGLEKVEGEWQLVALACNSKRLWNREEAMRHWHRKTEARGATEAAGGPAGPVTTELRFLEPGRVRLFRHGDGLRATIEGERSVLHVRASRAFPLSDPEHYIALCDEKNEQVGMLHDPRQLDPESLSMLEEELARRYLLTIVDRVESVEERFGTEEWMVHTARGMRTFTTRNLSDNVQRLSPTRLIVTDVDNNRYEIPDVRKLDSASRRVLSALL
jgi:hypothetical protein